MPLSFVQAEGCNNCYGKKSPISSQYLKKNTISREEKAIIKTLLKQQKKDNKSTSNTSNTSKLTDSSASRKCGKEQHTTWTEVHCSFVQLYKMRDLILSDNNSTNSIFCNKICHKHKRLG
eukprot:14629961-Ditylum_brightwellii.AAC.3